MPANFVALVFFGMHVDVKLASFESRHLSLGKFGARRNRPGGALTLRQGNDDGALFRGTLTQTSVYPREVVKRALHHNAGGVILAHNHPSGVAEQSHADETLTQALRQALALVDIRVLDHFIVAGSAVLSFAERGLL